MAGELASMKGLGGGGEYNNGSSSGGQAKPRGTSMVLGAQNSKPISSLQAGSSSGASYGGSVLPGVSMAQS